MEIDFVLGNLVSFVNGLGAGFDLNIAEIITAIGSGSLGGGAA